MPNNQIHKEMIITHSKGNGISKQTIAGHDANGTGPEYHKLIRHINT